MRDLRQAMPGPHPRGQGPPPGRPRGQPVGAGVEQRADVPAELHTYPGGTHDFDPLAPRSALARRFIRDRDEALRRAFRR